MYTIGVFSKMNRITTKTLRYYDEIGLLKPAYIDESSGYRYYSSQELTRLSRIVTLKQMGLTLADIKSIIDDPKGVEIYLKVKERELIDLIQQESDKLLSIKNYQKRLKGESIMAYSPVVRSLPEVIVASMRVKVDSYNSYFEVVPKMGQEMNRLGAVCAEPAYCFNMYHDKEYKTEDIDVEVCESVVDYCEDSALVKFKKIEGVKTALCILHKGPYEKFREVYTFAYEWIEDNNYKIVGLARESYIDGIWNKESDSDWLTEIQIPIEKK